MTAQEVRGIKPHLNDLDNELSSRLAEDMRSETSVEPDTLINSKMLVSLAALGRQALRRDSQSTTLGWSRRA
jgi:hypothetical protein